VKRRQYAFELSSPGYLAREMEDDLRFDDTQQLPKMTLVGHVPRRYIRDGRQMRRRAPPDGMNIRSLTRPPSASAAPMNPRPP
jgi:hypothetical protein